jgi:hypothetical protein
MLNRTIRKLNSNQLNSLMSLLQEKFPSLLKESEKQTTIILDCIEKEAYNCLSK